VVLVYSMAAQVSGMRSAPVVQTQTGLLVRCFLGSRYQDYWAVISQRDHGGISLLISGERAAAD